MMADSSRYGCSCVALISTIGTVVSWIHILGLWVEPKHLTYVRFMTKILKNLCEDRVVFHYAYSKNSLWQHPGYQWATWSFCITSTILIFHATNGERSSPAIRARSAPFDS